MELSSLGRGCAIGVPFAKRQLFGFSFAWLHACTVGCYPFFQEFFTHLTLQAYFKLLDLPLLEGQAADL